MNNFVLITDSTADLSENVVKELGVEVIPIKFVMDDELYYDGELSNEEFYGKIASGAQVSTTQINPQEFIDVFEKHLKNNQDIIYVSFSSGLSGIYNSACIAVHELKQLYPQRTIRIIDSLSASLGEGMLVYNMAQMKQSGASFDEIVNWAEDTKHKICHWFMVNDLNHLQRGGRISRATAVVGGMLNIKPILFIENDGKLTVREKARGRRNAIEILMQKLKDQAENLTEQTVFVLHSASANDAKFLAEKIISEVNPKEVVVSDIGFIISAHTGPGTVAVVFISNERK